MSRGSSSQLPMAGSPEPMAATDDGHPKAPCVPAQAAAAAAEQNESADAPWSVCINRQRDCWGVHKRPIDELRKSEQRKEEANEFREYRTAVLERGDKCPYRVALRMDKRGHLMTETALRSFTAAELAHEQLWPLLTSESTVSDLLSGRKDKRVGSRKRTKANRTENRAGAHGKDTRTPCREERRGGWPRSRRAKRFPKHVNYGTNREPVSSLRAPPSP